MRCLRAAGFALCVAGSALSACGDGGGGSKMGGAPRAPRPVKVTTRTAVGQPLTYSVQALGTLEAYQVVTVPARLAGTLESVAFEEGDTVTPDRVLAVIDGERHRLEVAQAESAVTRADANLTKTDAVVVRMQAQIDGAASALAEAQANLSRREALQTKAPGSVTTEDLASARATVAKMKSSLDEANAARGEAVAARGESAAAIGDAKARLALVRKTQAESEVRSPIAGVVQTKSVSAGQYVKEGTAIATLVDTRSLRLRFPISEGESVRVVRGPHVSFVAQALPQKTFRADLFHVNEVADPRTRMVDCLATVLEPDPALKPGFFANVTIETGQASDAITVDENAVLATEQGFVVFVVDGTKARRRSVTRGLLTKDGQREILSGLSAGDVIVLQGAGALQDGLAIEVVGPAASSGPAAGPEGERPAGKAPAKPPPSGAAESAAPGPPPASTGGVK